MCSFRPFRPFRRLDSFWFAGRKLPLFPGYGGVGGWSHGTSVSCRKSLRKEKQHTNSYKFIQQLKTWRVFFLLDISWYQSLDNSWSCDPDLPWPKVLTLWLIGYLNMQYWLDWLTCHCCVSGVFIDIPNWCSFRSLIKTRSKKPESNYIELNEAWL